MIAIDSRYTADDRTITVERLMKDHGDRVLRLCCVYLRDYTLAEDAAQDTFVKAYRALERIPRGEDGEKAWLLRIAINTCKNYRRSAWFRGRDKVIPLERIADLTDSTTYDIAVLTEVSALPSKYKDVILLYYYQGMSADEIARILSVSRSSVFNRLKAARKKLRVKLGGGYQDE